MGQYTTKGLLNGYKKIIVKEKRNNKDQCCIGLDETINIDFLLKICYNLYI